MFLNDFELKNFSFNSSSGTIKNSIYLDEGKNKIKIIYNHNGTEETATYDVRCGESDDDTNFDNNNEDQDTLMKPYIDFLYPASGATIDMKNITVKALVKFIENKYNIDVFIDDEPFYAFVYDENSETLNIELKNLEEKEYDIKVEAANSSGTFEKNLSFYYEEPLAGPPEVLINSPRNGFTTEDKIAIFKASVENLKDTKDLTVYLNGEIFKDYDYDKDRGIIFGYLPIELGTNTVKVEARNKLGSNFDEVSFKCKMEHLPGVQITTPKNGVIAGTALIYVEAIVQNVKKSTDVLMFINGSPYKSFTLSNEKLESKLYLSKGTNEIVVKALNDSGSSADTINVTFSGPPTKPEILFTNPAKSNTTVSDKKYTLEAKVTGIKHSSFVKLYVNELLIDDIEYYKDENVIKADLKLSKGINIIKLIATNDTGSTTESTRIYLE
ncbi:MAG: hypothetical protein R2771_01480 [Saprospiraceae bacterium]